MMAIGGALSCTGSIAQGIKQVRTPGFKGRAYVCRTRVESSDEGLTERGRREEAPRFFRHAYTRIRECVHICVVGLVVHGLTRNMQQRALTAE